MRRRRIKKILFSILTLIIGASGLIAALTVLPARGVLLETAAYAGSFFASPRTALAAMGQTWADEHSTEETAGSAGGFWMQLPKQQAEEETAQPQQTQQTPPEGSAPVEETTYSASVGGIYLAAGAGILKNMTELPAAEVEAEIGQPLPFSIELDSDQPQVLIMHSHTTECYRSAEGLWYDPAESFRTTDNSRNMVSVGAEIAAVLNAAGINTIQDTTQHDYPSYNGSYDRSEVTVQGYLDRYPSIKVVLDIHRDAIQRQDGTGIAPVTVINGEKTAQVMIICGADNGSMGMPNYKQNLRFAAALQDRMATMFPTLARPVLFDYRNYNQQLTTGSLLIEVGSHVNTLAEAKAAGRFVGQALADLLANG